jgi:hypothetical protein
VNVDYKWLIIGMVVGYVVVPRLHAVVVSKTSSTKAA